MQLLKTYVSYPSIKIWKIPKFAPETPKIRGSGNIFDWLCSFYSFLYCYTNVSTIIYHLQQSCNLIWPIFYLSPTRDTKNFSPKARADRHTFHFFYCFITQWSKIILRISARYDPIFVLSPGISQEILRISALLWTQHIWSNCFLSPPGIHRISAHLKKHTIQFF